MSAGWRGSGQKGRRVEWSQERDIFLGGGERELDWAQEEVRSAVSVHAEF